MSSILILKSIYKHLKDNPKEKCDQDLLLITQYLKKKIRINQKNNNKILNIIQNFLLKAKSWLLGYGPHHSLEVADQIIDELNAREYSWKDKFNTEEFKEFKQAIDDKNKDTFSDLLNRKRKSEIAYLTGAYLKFLSKNSFAEDEHIDFLLDQLKSKYCLNFHPYFDREFGGILLNPKGIQTILDDLSSKDKITGDQVVLCEDFDKFTQEIKKFDWQTPINKSFVLRHTDEVWRDCQHISHVHIEVEVTGAINIYITDTLGLKTFPHGDTQISFNDLIIKSLEKIIPQSSNTIIYYPTVFRQTNQTSCPIFAVHDAVRIFRKLANLEFIKNQKNLTEPADPTQPVKVAYEKLPPDLMISQQYKVHLLESSYSHLHELITPQIGKTAVSLKEKIDAHTRWKEVEGKTISENNYTRKKEISYLGIILSKILSNST